MKVELRIHGVAGASPRSVLYPGSDGPGEVAEDGVSGGVGFYHPVPQPNPGWIRQAYVWGGLTSGARTRALWLLLLPFALVNIAFFMTPHRIVDGREREKPLRKTVDAFQRLFALSLTATALLGFTGIYLDILAWQSAQTPFGGPLSWLSTNNAGDIAMRLALSSLLPALALSLIWLLSSRTWKHTDQTPVPQGAPPSTGPLLTRRRMWNGGAPVGRLRSLHVSFGFTLIALTLTLASPTPWLFTTEAVIGALVILLVTLPQAATREDPTGPDGAERERSKGWVGGRSTLTTLCTALRWAGLLVYIAAAVVPLTEPGRPATPGPLPGFDPTVQVILWTQIALMALVAVGVAILARNHEEPETRYRRAMFGLAAPATMLIAWAYTAALTIGASFIVAELAGTPAFSRTQVPEAIVLPESYAWALYAVPIAFLMLIALALYLLRTYRRTARKIDDLITAHYPQTEHRRVSKAWAAAALTDKAQAVFAVIALTALGTVILVAVILATQMTMKPWPPLVLAGTIILIVFVVALMVVGYAAYRLPGLRRTVGVLWDVSTFWPRATHPFAPPCYSERVVPELLTRVNHLTGTGHTVVISGHSQGSVIAAAVVLQLDPADRAATRLLTHGSPLRRLYARFFPTYFDLTTLHEVRAATTWQNLYRNSDPIGGPVVTDIDLAVWDPVSPPLDSPIRGHIDYYVDDDYRTALDSLTRP
ncbi:hypothetical protein Aph01nite_47500 [Acrocarpospora phusangensis]|uniref:Integral membrane protein n=1 Tax=Acrocarpospora phusangensis TaxID=1070424 RepID=A0A919QH98_9ACTN|nr:hypothetical protein [Acrocarpospora phusangensis]GIH26440.1 hypothetical protein Aph01nite_47500 [Acrocarpospora phusangensis]